MKTLDIRQKKIIFILIVVSLIFIASIANAVIGKKLHSQANILLPIL